MRNIRVLVFGATGIGKTSLCNALTGKSRPTDNGARGVTSKSHLYTPFQFNDVKIEIVDTVGLHESSHGTVPAEQAVIELIELLEKARDGFSLMIHVARASRITKEHDDDYTFFVEKMAQASIPTLLVITGCENEQPMNAWATRNQNAFSRFSYKEIVSTCFASGGPMEEHFAPLRIESKQSLLNSVVMHALSEPKKIYGSGAGSSFNEVFTRLWNEFVVLAGLPKKYRRQLNESAYSLMKRMGVPQAIADAAIRHVPDLVEEMANKTPIPGAGKIARKLSELVLNKIRHRPVQ